MNAAVALILAAVLLDANATKTATLLQTLPEDGSWVTFQATAGPEGNNASLTWTLRSVGTAFHEGKKCRFLELEQTLDNGPKEIYFYQLQPFVWRVLIPEEAFGEGKDPLSHAVMSWFKKGDDEPVAMLPGEGPDPILSTIIRGPAGNFTTESEREKVSWQQGQLSCSVQSGQRELEFAGAELKFDFRVLRSDEVPFSIGGLRQEIKTVFNGEEYKIGINANLRNHGTRAEAKLPGLTP